jgi:hypothetical protein
MKRPIAKPNLFVVGAAKAGTTTLYELLRQHPQVYFPMVKEPAFFCDDAYFARGDDWYLDQFFRRAENQPWRGDASSRYLYFAEKTAPRIASFTAPDIPRVVMIFREPAQLVYSMYWNSVREGKESLPFSEALAAETQRMELMRVDLEKSGQILYAYSRLAAYASQVSVYLRHFPRESFLFLLTEDLADTNGLVHLLQSFLELDDYASLIRPVKKNAAALPRSTGLHRWLRNRSMIKEGLKKLLPFQLRYRLKNAAIEMNLKSFTPPPMEETIAAQLRRDYRDEVLRLQDLISRDLSGWLGEG